MGFAISKGLFTKYFILKPIKRGIIGTASREALRRFIEVVKKERPELASDLTGWLIYINGQMTNEEKEVEKGLKNGG